MHLNISGEEELISTLKFPLYHQVGMFKMEVMSSFLRGGVTEEHEESSIDLQIVIPRILSIIGWFHLIQVGILMRRLSWMKVVLISRSSNDYKISSKNNSFCSFCCKIVFSVIKKGIFSFCPERCVYGKIRKDRS